MSKIEEILESLSLVERQILPFVREGMDEVEKRSGLDNTSILRALQFLENKGLIVKDVKKSKVIDLDDNGRIYLGEGLPERKLLSLLIKEKSLTIKDAKVDSKLNDQEFSVALGSLKNKALVRIDSGNVSFVGKKDDTDKKFFEEELLVKLPVSLDSLEGPLRLAYENLKERKGIIKVRDVSDYVVKLTSIGEDVARCTVDSSYDNMIEQVTPDIINNESWRGKKFRRYDVKSRVPEISGGKKHFVNQSVDYGKRIWSDLGFKEMTGLMTQTSFWNFDSLFTPQDHPVREMQDTFFIKDAIGKLPNKKIVDAVKSSHEGKIKGSKGWQYEWKEEGAKRVLMRTQTTGLSAKTLAKLGELKNSNEKEGKFFALGMNFRNETVDWSHGFQFNQTEGIVVGKGLNFKNLLWYLREFFKKMGYEKVRFRPAYFPYTEPSVEIEVWHPERKIWWELGGAGMFRPEVTIPLLGEHIPVLAWGPGFDRTMMDYYKITDLREFYENDLTKSRKKRMWMK
ncbi:MAG: phenylalanine--tRNA ligase subunit alpha [Nanoarchaeota archaeon]